MTYFTIEELSRSERARQLGLDNRPPEIYQQHLRQLIEELLDPLRAAWTEHCATKLQMSDGTPPSPALLVASGYRCEALNRAVGGVPRSAHRVGWAVDLIPANRQMTAFKEFCRTFLADRPFDQLISEKETKEGAPRWIHLALYDEQGRQRRQMLSLYNGSYLPMR